MCTDDLGVEWLLDAEGPTEPTAADIEEAKEEKESGGEAVGEAERESGQSDNEGGDGNGDN